MNSPSSWSININILNLLHRLENTINDVGLIRILVNYSDERVNRVHTKLSQTR